MPRITRKQQKIFAESASNNGVFGSLQANDPTLSSDPDAIQGRTAYENGWNDATYSADELPPLEEFQALQYLFSRQIAYTMQEGISEWDASTTYYKGSMVKAIQGDGSFILYSSLVDNNTGNAVTDTSKWVITNTSTNFHQGIPNWRADVIYSEGDWVKAFSDGSWTIFESKQDNNLNNAISDTSYWEIKPFTSEVPMLTPLWADHEINDVRYLRADTFSWQDGTVYTNAYQHLLDDYNNPASVVTDTIGGISVTYRLASDGHKIVPSTYEQYVIDMFNATGVAWYYIIDTVNQKFKLPRTKFGFTGLRDSVSKYVQPGLPNITGAIGSIQTGASGGSGSGAFYISAAAAGNNYAAAYGYQNTINFDASRSSGIYGKSSTVQPPATQMYLYFYVGQFTQSAIQQTAGITTAQLNAKVDLDAGNLSSAGKSTVSGLGMPGDSFDSLTLLASGQTYTLTENGYICLSATFSSDGWLYMYRSASRYGYTIRYGAATWVDCCLYGKKGTQITIQYNGTPSVQSFRFIPAEGEE